MLAFVSGTAHTISFGEVTASNSPRLCYLTSEVFRLSRHLLPQKLPLKGLEPLHLAPEASALSSELQGLPH